MHLSLAEHEQWDRRLSIKRDSMWRPCALSEILHMFRSSTKADNSNQPIANIRPLQRDGDRNQLYPWVRAAGSLRPVLRLPRRRKPKGVLLKHRMRQVSNSWIFTLLLLFFMYWGGATDPHKNSPIPCVTWLSRHVNLKILLNSAVI